MAKRRKSRKSFGARAGLWRLADRHFRTAGPGPADDGPDGQQHPHGHLLGDRAADRRVRARRQGPGGIRRGMLKRLGDGPEREARSGVFLAQSLPNACVLPGLGDLPTPSAKFEAWARLPQMWGEATRYCRHRRQNRRREQLRKTPPAESQTCASTRLLLRAPLPLSFPLSWSHYVRLMSVEKPHARAFYETEAIRGGWSVRQLDRQISTQFFERTSHSKQQAAMLARGQRPKPEDAVSVQDEIATRICWSSSISRTSTARANWRMRSFGTWKGSCWSWGQGSPSSPGRSGSASATSGIASTCCFFIAGCGAWW